MACRRGRDRHKRATASQVSIASQYGVPHEQAHTVNTKKFRAYLQWLQLPIVKLMQFLDRLEAQRLSDKGGNTIE